MTKSTFVETEGASRAPNTEVAGPKLSDVAVDSAKLGITRDVPHSKLSAAEETQKVHDRHRHDGTESLTVPGGMRVFSPSGGTVAVNGRDHHRDSLEADSQSLATSKKKKSGYADLEEILRIYPQLQGYEAQIQQALEQYRKMVETAKTAGPMEAQGLRNALDHLSDVLKGDLAAILGNKDLSEGEKQEHIAAIEEWLNDLLERKCEENKDLEGAVLLLGLRAGRLSELFQFTRGKGPLVSDRKTVTPEAPQTEIAPLETKEEPRIQIVQIIDEFLIRKDKFDLTDNEKMIKAIEDYVRGLKSHEEEIRDLLEQYRKQHGKELMSEIDARCMPFAAEQIRYLLNYDLHGFETSKNRWAGIFGSLSKVDGAYSDLIAARDRIDPTVQARINDELLALTEDHELLVLVLRQRNREELSEDNLKILDDKYDQAKKLREKVDGVFARTPEVGAYVQAFYIYNNEVTEFLRGYKYLDDTALGAAVPQDSSRYNVEEVRAIRQHLDSQFARAGLASSDPMFGLNGIIVEVENERSDYVLRLKRAETDEEFLKILSDIPSSAMRQVAAKFGEPKKDETGRPIKGEVTLSLMDAIGERYSKYDITRYRAEALVQGDRCRTDAIDFLTAYQKGPTAINEFLASLPAESRVAAVQRAMSESERFSNCLKPPMLGGWLRDAQSAEQLLAYRMSGDDLLTAKGLLSNDSIAVLVTDIHKAIVSGNGLSAATSLNMARTAGQFSLVQQRYLATYKESLGQDIQNHQSDLSPEMLLAVRAAARGEGVGVTVAAIRDHLDFGDAAKGEAHRVWEVLEQLEGQKRLAQMVLQSANDNPDLLKGMSSQERARFEYNSAHGIAELNRDFALYLTSDEKNKLLRYLQSNGKQGATESDLTLENFLRSKLSPEDMRLPQLLLTGKDVSAWDILRHGMMSSNGVDDAFIEQKVLALLMDPENGAKARAQIEAGYAELRASRPGLPENFFTWVSDRVSHDVGKKLGQALISDHLIDNVADLKFALQHDDRVSWVTRQVLDVGNDQYDSSVASAMALARKLELAGESEKKEIKLQLSRALASLRIHRQTLLQFQEIMADVSANVAGTVVGTGLMFVPGLQGVGGVLIVTTASIGTRVGVYSLVSGHGPDGERLKGYVVSGVMDGVSFGVARGAAAISSRVATRLGAQSASRMGFVWRQAAAGAAGGGFYGAMMGAADQIRDGEFRPLGLIRSTATGALMGGAINGVMATSSQLQRSTLLSNKSEKTVHIEGKTKLTPDQTLEINPGTAVGQKSTFSEVKTPIGTVKKVETGFDQTRTTYSNRNGGFGGGGSGNSANHEPVMRNGSQEPKKDTRPQPQVPVPFQIAQPRVAPPLEEIEAEKKAEKKEAAKDPVKPSDPKNPPETPPEFPPGASPALEVPAHDLPSLLEKDGEESADDVVEFEEEVPTYQAARVPTTEAQERKNSERAAKHHPASRRGSEDFQGHRKPIIVAPVKDATPQAAKRKSKVEEESAGPGLVPHAEAIPLEVREANMRAAQAERELHSGAILSATSIGLNNADRLAIATEISQGQSNQHVDSLLSAQPNAQAIGQGNAVGQSHATTHGQAQNDIDGIRLSSGVTQSSAQSTPVIQVDTLGQSSTHGIKHSEGLRVSLDQGVGNADMAVSGVTNAAPIAKSIEEQVADPLARYMAAGVSVGIEIPEVRITTERTAIQNGSSADRVEISKLESEIETPRAVRHPRADRQHRNDPSVKQEEPARQAIAIEEGLSTDRRTSVGESAAKDNLNRDARGHTSPNRNERDSRSDRHRHQRGETPILAKDKHQEHSEASSPVPVKDGHRHAPIAGKTESSRGSAGGERLISGLDASDLRRQGEQLRLALEKDTKFQALTDLRGQIKDDILRLFKADQNKLSMTPAQKREIIAELQKQLEEVDRKRAERVTIIQMTNEKELIARTNKVKHHKEVVHHRDDDRRKKDKERLKELQKFQRDHANRKVVFNQNGRPRVPSPVVQQRNSRLVKTGSND